MTEAGSDTPEAPPSPTAPVEEVWDGLAPWQRWLARKADFDVAQTLDELLESTFNAVELLAGAGTRPTGPRLPLRSISATGLNAVRSASPLTFADRLTIVYGSNGSGKSSYMRALHHACRSNVKPEPILADVFESPGTGVRSVVLTFGSADDAEPFATISVDLEGTSPPPDELRGGVLCYDRDSVSVYMERRASFAYTPAGLEVFKALSDRQKALQTEAKRRVDADLTPALNAIVDGAPDAAASVLRAEGPSQSSAPDELDEPSRDSLRLRVQELDKSLVDRASRGKTSSDLRRASELLQPLVMLIAEGYKYAGAFGRGELATLQDSATTLRALADRDARAQAVAGMEPGPEDGTWRQLWSASNAYLLRRSTDHPPHLEAGDVCPLCTQVVSLEASARIQTLAASLSSDSQRAAEEAERKLTDAVSRRGQVAEKLRASGEQLEMLNHVSVEERRSILAEIENVIRLMTADPGLPDPSVDTKPGAATQAQSRLRADSSKLEASLTDPEAEQRIRVERDAVVANLWIAEHSDDVQRARDLSAKIRTVEDWRSKLATSDLTRRVAALSRQILGATFVRHLERLLRDLRFPYLEQLEIGLPGDAGGVAVQLAFNTASGVRIPQVLSEGEATRLGIACFLAEALSFEQCSTIILDDPVTSLDHEIRRMVADALAEVALDRQVIVFTHDLVFQHELGRAAHDVLSDGGAHLCRIHRARTGAGSVVTPLKAGRGVIDPIFARQGQPSAVATKLVAALEALDEDSAEWVHDAFSAAHALRDLTERLVEVEVLGGVVTRLTPGVQTQRLIQVVSTEEVTKRVNRLMSELSRWAHAEAPAINGPDPAKLELIAAANEIVALTKLCEQARGVQKPWAAFGAPGGA